MSCATPIAIYQVISVSTIYLMSSQNIGLAVTQDGINIKAKMFDYLILQLWLNTIDNYNKWTPSLT